jgi:3-deoxy-manno-octulosonate cytidylyltransferase (CMP-KDO synthetase)
MIITGIIPARYASTRFPGKPLVDINGKSMIQRVYEQAEKALQYVCVATDDRRIKNAVKSFGGNVVMTSPLHKSGTDRCAEAVEILEKQGVNTDIVINIQGDEPFIEPTQINQLIKIFDNSNAQIATLIKKIKSTETIFDVNKVKVVTSNTGKAIYFSRSSIPFVRNRKKNDWISRHDFFLHVGMYGYRRNVLSEICKLEQGTLEKAESLEQLRWIENGYNIFTAITDIETIGIDTPNDLIKVLSMFS